MSLRRYSFNRVGNVIGTLPRGVFGLAPVSTSLIPPGVVVAGCETCNCYSGLGMIMFRNGVAGVKRAVFRGYGGIAIVFGSVVPPAAVGCKKL